MDAEILAREALVLEDFDSFYRQTFARVARAAALVARDQETGQELAQEAFLVSTRDGERCRPRSMRGASRTA